MKYAIIASLMMTTSVHAGNLVTVGLDDPEVIPPARFSWGGVYGGLTYGQSQHTREYTRTWEEDITREREIHNYNCTRGKEKHFGRKCNVTGFTDAEELQALDNVNRPWQNAADQDVRYQSGYDGLWMGSSEVFSFSLPDQRSISNQPRWAQMNYLGFDTVVDVIGTESFSETYEVTHNDTTLGGFIGYRHEISQYVVLGVEANAFQAMDLGEDFYQIEAQAGISLGRVLPFVGIGPDHFSVGTDIAITDNVLIGIRHWDADEDSGTQVRIGWMF
jgi:hypothetical protein